MLLATAAGAFVASAANIVYQNDFAVRHSGPVPSGEWHTLAYGQGALAFNYNAANYDTANHKESYPYQGAMQDSWVKAKAYQGGASTDQSLALVAWPDGDNSCAMIVGDKKGYRTWMLHPLFSAVSNGVLRFTYDMRGPRGAREEVTTLMLQPLYRQNLGPDFPLGSWKQPVYVAINVTKEGSVDICHLPGGGGLQKPASSRDATHWYRFDVAMDLSAGRYSLAVDDMGTGHPLPTSAGDRIVTVTDCAMYDVVAGEPIAGFCLYAANVRGAGTLSKGIVQTAVPEQAVCCDNVSVRWTAPGTGDERLIYENDFSTRRWRSAEKGPTAHAYGAGAEVDDVFADYVANSPASPTATLLIAPGNGIGTDGWRRWNPAGSNDGMVSVVDEGGAGGNALCVSYAQSGAHFGCVMIPLGKSYTSGKVRFSADVRTPGAFTQGWLGWAKIGLGDARTYVAAQSQHNDYLAAQFGLDDSDGAAPYSVAPADGTLLKDIQANAWYRLVLTYDLTERKRNMRIYELGESSGTIDREVGELAYEKTETGGFLKGNCADIGVLVLHHYGPAAAGYAGATLFDNLVFAEAVDTPEEKVVYSNDFNTRTWHGVSDTSLVGAIDRIGEDGWIRRNAGVAAVSVRGEGAAVSFDSRGTDRKSCIDHAWIVQDLGANVLAESSRTMFCADIRPPAVWTGASGWYADPSISQQGEVAFGGDGLAQGAHSDYLAGHAALRFGCKGPCQQARTQADKLDVLGNSHVTYLYVQDGATRRQSEKSVDPTHWYRFVATVRPGRSTYDVSVYDMGTTHPTVETPLPATPSHTFADVSFSSDIADGITAVALGAADVEPRFPRMADDCTALLVNNVVVRTSDGFSLIVR